MLKEIKANQNQIYVKRKEFLSYIKVAFSLEILICQLQSDIWAAFCVMLER